MAQGCREHSSAGARAQGLAEAVQMLREEQALEMADHFKRFIFFTALGTQVIAHKASMSTPNYDQTPPNKCRRLSMSPTDDGLPFYEATPPAAKH